MVYIYKPQNWETISSIRVLEPSILVWQLAEARKTRGARVDDGTGQRDRSLYSTRFLFPLLLLNFTLTKFPFSLNRYLLHPKLFIGFVILYFGPLILRRLHVFRVTFMVPGLKCTLHGYTFSSKWTESTDYHRVIVSQLKHGRSGFHLKKCAPLFGRCA